MMARESHTTPLLCREVVRENRVNQSGSVALSTEAMRGPPWRNLLIITTLLTQLRTRGSWVRILPGAPNNQGLTSVKCARLCACRTSDGPFIHRLPAFATRSTV